MRITNFIISTGDVSNSSSLTEGTEFVTGSITHGSSPVDPITAKITLRQGGSYNSLGTFNVVIGKDDIINSSGEFLVTGSLSASTQPNSTDALSAKGDVLVISQGS